MIWQACFGLILLSLVPLLILLDFRWLKKCICSFSYPYSTIYIISYYIFNSIMIIKQTVNYTHILKCFIFFFIFWSTTIYLIKKYITHVISLFIFILGKHISISHLIVLLSLLMLYKKCNKNKCYLIQIYLKYWRNSRAYKYMKNIFFICFSKREK